MDDQVEKLLEAFREITATESVEYVWQDGCYQGAMVVYKMPILGHREVFHPYIPLTSTGVLVDPETFEPVPGEQIEPPKLTREWFIENGLSVPGEGRSARS